MIRYDELNESQAEKEQLRLKIEQQTKLFLKNGGKIIKLKPGDTGLQFDKIKNQFQSIKSHYETNINTKRKPTKRK